MTPEEDLTLSGLLHDLNNVFQTMVDAADLLSGDAQWQHHLSCPAQLPEWPLSIGTSAAGAV